MPEKIPRKHAIPVQEFNSLLAGFYADADPSDRLGETEFGDTPWLWVKFLGNRYFLNADSTAAGVGRYLELVKGSAGSLAWTTVLDEGGTTKNRVAFGPGAETIPGFHFYRADVD